MSIFSKKSTRTPETEAQYLNRVVGLEAKATRELMETIPSVALSNSLTPMQLAVWSVDRRKDLKIAASTMRTDRSALIFAFEQMVDSEEAVQAALYLRENRFQQYGSPLSKNTSAKKSKVATYDDVVKFCIFLKEGGSKYGDFCSYILWFTYHLGLRPSEWRTAEIVQHAFEFDGEPELALKVRNAKNTNGRSHGEYRHIPIMHLGEDGIAELNYFLDLILELTAEISYEKLQTTCSVYMTRSSKRCFPRRKKGISIYTARHQFSANAKKSLPLQHVGALMGHAVSETSQTHYATARSGTIVEGLRASEYEIMRVRDNAKVYGEPRGVSNDDSEHHDNDLF